MQWRPAGSTVPAAGRSRYRYMGHALSFVAGFMLCGLSVYATMYKGSPRPVIGASAHQDCDVVCAAAVGDAVTAAVAAATRRGHGHADEPATRVTAPAGAAASTNDCAGADIGAVWWADGHPTPASRTSDAARDPVVLTSPLCALAGHRLMAAQPSMPAGGVLDRGQAKLCAAYDFEALSQKSQTWYQYGLEHLRQTVPQWAKVRADAGLPVRALELGSYEGMSTQFFLGNAVNGHPASYLVAVDMWNRPAGLRSASRDLDMKSTVEPNFDRNIRAHPCGGRVIKLAAATFEVLPTLVAHQLATTPEARVNADGSTAPLDVTSVEADALRVRDIASIMTDVPGDVDAGGGSGRSMEEWRALVDVGDVARTADVLPALEALTVRGGTADMLSAGPGPAAGLGGAGAGASPGGRRALPQAALRRGDVGGAEAAAARAANPLPEALPADPGMFDLIYVDASHKTEDALYDAVMADRLLSAGGLLLFDDTNLLAGASRGATGGQGPGLAVRLFLHAVGPSKYRVLLSKGQIHLQKLRYGIAV